MCGRDQIQAGGENRAMTVNWTKAQRKAAHTARWAVTMTKVRIRQALAQTRWQLVTFCGISGAESVGVVDLMAIRKDHGKPLPDTKRGDAFQIILIQVKGGQAPGVGKDDLLDAAAAAWTALRRHRGEAICVSTSERDEKGLAATIYY